MIPSLKIHSDKDASSLINTAYLCHTEGHVLPFWAQKQLSPESPTFQPPIANHFGNTAYRSWTTLRVPHQGEYLTIDPVGMCSPNNTWGLDIWLMQKGEWFNLSTLPDHSLTFENDTITILGNIPGVAIQITICLDPHPSPAGYLTVSLSKITAPVSLFLAIRPYGVSDVFPIRDLTYHSNGAMIVNRQLGIVFLDPPQNILCLPFSEGDSATHIGRWEQILKTTCPSEFATGYVEYRITQETALIRAWLPLNKSFSFAHDIAKPLEQIQLKSWIQEFKDRNVPNTSKTQRSAVPTHQETSELQHLISKHLYHLQQAENEQETTDPWDFLTQMGRLYWIPANDPSFAQIGHACLTQATRRLTQKPTPANAGIFMLIQQQLSALSGEVPNLSLLQKAIKIAMTLPLPEKMLPETKIKNPFDHDFGSGPYWLTYFWSLSILNMALPMIAQGPQQESILQHKMLLESKIQETLLYWTQCQHLPPMLPISNTRWNEPTIVTSLLTVFPMGVVDPFDIHVSNTLLTLQNTFLHNDILFSRAHPAGYPIVENLMLAMAYLLRQDTRCHSILDWVIRHVSPTGAFPRSIHPISHMGADGTGHHLAASGLFLTVIRHLFIQESATGCHLCRMLPQQFWNSAWTLPHMRILQGSLSVAYTPDKTEAILVLENHGSAALDIHLHLPDGSRLISEMEQLVLKTGEKRRIVFSKE